MKKKTSGYLFILLTTVIFSTMEVMLRYTRGLFGMYGGRLTRVTLEGRREMVGPLIDRFGKDVTIQPIDDDTFTASVEVSASRHFIAWIIALGDGIRITGPKSLVDDMRAEAKRLAELYS